MSACLGIIGGGQLAMYLCGAAQDLGLKVAVITDSAEDGALQCADWSVVDALDSTAAIDRFLGVCDVVTFDKEAIPERTLLHLIKAQSQGRVAINPGAETLLLLKDKALQKTWLQEHGLPTLPFNIISGSAGTPEFMARKSGGALVQKVRSGGYDGRGVQILDGLDAGQRLWNVPSIVEPFLPGCREIAVITVRAQGGDIQTYPPVSMEFDPELNAVRTVSVPAAVSPALGAAATALAERVAILLSGVGAFAVEMFVTPEGELLINEISPRVHNSGHLTLDAFNVSQFEQHVRAVTGMPLVPIEFESPAAMMNILYGDEMRGHCPQVPRVYGGVEPRSKVYWYGKQPGSTGRKMGHVNALAATAAEAVTLAGRTLDKLSGGASERAA